MQETAGTNHPQCPGAPERSTSRLMGGTKTKDHPSKGHDASILPWAYSAFAVGDCCDVGAIGVRVFVSPDWSATEPPDFSETGH
jgi:hypothetical protein